MTIAAFSFYRECLIVSEAPNLSEQLNVLLHFSLGDFLELIGDDLAHFLIAQTEAKYLQCIIGGLPIGQLLFPVL
jgi:hypothetical protein